MSAQLNPRFVITDKHFINAYLLMFRIDYVLPFWRYLKDENVKQYFGMNTKMWNITYNHIVKHFVEKEYKYIDNNNNKHWSYKGHTTGRTDQIHSHNVAQNITKNDILALTHGNRYDLALFKLAQYIADVDATFYEL